MTPPRILHVLPHAGAGGETYIAQLGALQQYQFERFLLSERRRPAEAVRRLPRLARAARDHDLVHIHGDSAALVCLPIIGLSPTVITLHGSHLLRRSTGARAALVRMGMRRAFARVDTVIAVSDSELEYARAIAPRAANRITLIRNGIRNPDPISESDRLRIREELGLSETSVAALFVGELSERKQPLQFAEAVQLARDANPELVGYLAGDGPLRPAIEARRGKGVSVLGDRRDVEQLLGAADVFVLPSLREGLSYAVLEAMAVAKATLVSSGPGNPDAVGDAGLVFPVGDVPAMAAALSRLAGDTRLRESLGQAAAARVRERFTLSGMTGATASVYDRALSRKRDQ
jgi:glycosyltransferase involved in cell wall biosynthesis